MNLKFPVTAYHKYNGFLGIAGYDSEQDKLFLASKSTETSWFAQWFKEILERKVDPEKLKEYLASSNTSLVFEVIDPIRDPHIIEYPKQNIILLDSIERSLEYNKDSFDHLLHVGESFLLPVKERVAILKNWQDFYNFHEESMKEDFTLSGNPVEGFVYEDSAGFMVKSKLSYYKKWKTLRYYKEKLVNQRDQTPIATGGLLDNEMTEFFFWMKKKPKEELSEKDIISLRREWKAQGA